MNAHDIITNHITMTSSQKAQSTTTSEWTKSAKSHDLHFPCVSIATVQLLATIEAEPLPAIPKVKGVRNRPSPSPKCTIGPLVTNGLVRLEDSFYRATHKGIYYLKALKEAGLL